MREGWTRTTLGEVSTSRLGKMLSKVSKTGIDESPYLRNANVQWNRLELEDLSTMHFSAAERVEFELRAGDVVICEGGEVGRAAVLDTDLAGVYFQKAIHRVRCGRTLLPRFLMLYMEYLARTGGLADYSTQLTIQHLTGEKLRTLPLELPSLAEQRRIVDVISAADNQLAAAKAEQWRASATLDSLREREFGRLARQSAPLGRLMTRVRRPIRVEPASLYREIGIRSHGRGIFHKEAVSGASLGNKKIFRIEPGDLVLNIVFAWEGAVAVAGPDEMGRCGSHRFPTYVVTDRGDLQFLKHFFASSFGRDHLNLASPGSAGRNRTLNQSMLMELKVPAPTLDVQRELDALLAAAEALVAKTEKLTRAASDLRAALLADFLSGDHEIPASYDAVLDVSA